MAALSAEGRRRDDALAYALLGNAALRWVRRCMHTALFCLQTNVLGTGGMGRHMQPLPMPAHSALLYTC